MGRPITQLEEGQVFEDRTLDVPQGSGLAKRELLRSIDLEVKGHLARSGRGQEQHPGSSGFRLADDVAYPVLRRARSDYGGAFLIEEEPAGRLLLDVELLPNIEEIPGHKAGLAPVHRWRIPADADFARMDQIAGGAEPPYPWRVALFGAALVGGVISVGLALLALALGGSSVPSTSVALAITALGFLGALALARARHEAQDDALRVERALHWIHQRARRFGDVSSKRGVGLIEQKHGTKGITRPPARGVHLGATRAEKVSVALRTGGLGLLVRPRERTRRGGRTQGAEQRESPANTGKHQSSGISGWSS